MRAIAILAVSPKKTLLSNKSQVIRRKRKKGRRERKWGEISGRKKKKKDRVLHFVAKRGCTLLR